MLGFFTLDVWTCRTVFISPDPVEDFHYPTLVLYNVGG